MKKIIILIFLISQINALDFYLKGYLNAGVGTPGTNGDLLIADTDRDSLFELIFYPFSSPRVCVIFEQSPSNPFQFEFQTSIGTYVKPLFIGDYDLDGLYDMVCGLPWGLSGPSGICIYEQPDSFHYPLVAIYGDTTFGTIGYASGDADNDGLPDILILDGRKLLVYETRGNNLFERVFEDTIPSQDFSGVGISVPMDYDNDGKKEFVIGELSNRVWVGENRGNDIYCFIWKSPFLYTNNIYDVKSLPDLDKDGKNEFMVKGWVYPTARVDCFIFEATGNNNYEIIWDTIYSTASDGTGLSDIGDVDMDGELEIVLEYGDGFKVLKCIDNNKFIEIGEVFVNPGASQIKIAPDIDRNGINEVVVSGNNQTYFFEAILNANEKKLKIPSFSKIEFKNYKIFDLTGREVKKIEKGIYFIKLKEEGKTFKIIKIK